MSGRRQANGTDGILTSAAGVGGGDGGRPTGPVVQRTVAEAGRLPDRESARWEAAVRASRADGRVYRLAGTERPGGALAHRRAHASERAAILPV